MAGCIGGIGEDEPSNSTALDAATANNTSEEPNVTRVEEEGGTLTWTHLRATDNTNVVRNGDNCVFLNRVPANATVEKIEVHGNWTSDRIGDVSAMEFRVYAYTPSETRNPVRDVFKAPMNETLDGWAPPPDSPFYGTFAFYPPDPVDDAVYRPLVDMRVGFHAYVTYTMQGDPGEDAFDWRSGNCT